MRQLTGRTVAVNTLGNTAELGTRARLRQRGADPARVRLVEEESAQRVTMPAFRDSLDPADIEAAVDRAYDFGMLKGGSTPWRSYGRARPPVKAMLEVHNLRFVYPGSNGQGPTEAMGGRSLLVREREVVSIVGPSRCGKTTLVTCIIGLHPPPAGEVRLDGRRSRRRQGTCCWSSRSTSGCSCPGARCVATCTGGRARARPPPAADLA